MALEIEPGFVPEEVFGPSALKLDHQCPTAYALRYAVGLRERQLTYEEVSKLPVPVEPKKPGKDASTGALAAYKAKLKAYKKEKKAWNKQRRPALGTAGHAKAEAYFKGETVDWHDAPGKVMLAGLHYLPLPKRCAVIEPEQKIRVDLSYLYVEFPELAVDPLILQGTRDLVVQATAAAWSGAEVQPPGFDAELRWILIDHKTTLTFDFFDRDKTMKTVKTPEQLLEDEQVNLYGLQVMQEHGLDELRCRWIYYRTEDTPDARAVDVLITRKGAEAVVRDLAIQAIELRRRMRLKHPWETLKKVYDSCGNYGGCIYDKKNGGPCPGSESESPGQKLVRLRRKQQLGEKLKQEPKPEKKARPKIMAFRSVAAAAGITKPGTEKAPESTAEAQEPAVEETQAETSAPAEVEKPKSPGTVAPVKPKGSPRKNTNHEGVTAAFGGVVLELPPASPLAAAVVKAVEAHNAYQAALNGE